MDAIYEIQADVLRALSSPRRLELIHLLGERPRDVTSLAEATGLAQPNVSQHLAVMRGARIVEVQRVGRRAEYRLTDADVLVACDLMRGVLARQLARIGAGTLDALAPPRVPLAASRS